MTIKDLIKHLNEHPENMQVYVASDEEFNTLFTDVDLTVTEIEKSNNDGTYDALVIYGLSGSERE